MVLRARTPASAHSETDLPPTPGRTWRGLGDGPGADTRSETDLSPRLGRTGRRLRDGDAADSEMDRRRHWTQRGAHSESGPTGGGRGEVAAELGGGGTGIRVRAGGLKAAPARPGP